MNRHIPNRHRGRPDADKQGDKLYRDMTVRVIMPGQKDILWRSRAGARRGYTLDGIQTMLEQVAEHLEKRFPSVEFRVVELKPNVFNFCYEGRKETMKESLNACPEIARSAAIAAKICAEQGHKLGVFQNGTSPGPNGMPIMNVINFCTNCGMSLSEVRGEIDARLDAAVAQRVSEQFAAMAAANKPQVVQAKGPISVPPKDFNPDTQSPANSPSEALPE